MAETPSYFKKLIYAGGIVGTIGAGLLNAPEEVKELIPDFLNNIAGYMTVAGYVTSLISSLAVKEPEKLD